MSTLQFRDVPLFAELPEMRAPDRVEKAVETVLGAARRPREDMAFIVEAAVADLAHDMARALDIRRPTAAQKQQIVDDFMDLLEIHRSIELVSDILAGGSAPRGERLDDVLARLPEARGRHYRRALELWKKLYGDSAEKKCTAAAGDPKAREDLGREDHFESEEHLEREANVEREAGDLPGFAA